MRVETFRFSDLSVTYSTPLVGNSKPGLWPTSAERVRKNGPDRKNDDSLNQLRTEWFRDDWTDGNATGLRHQMIVMGKESCSEAPTARITPAQGNALEDPVVSSRTT